MPTPMQKYYAEHKEVQLARTEKCKRKRMCRMLHNHYNSMQHDPERLSLEFMQRIINVKCNNDV